MPISLYTAARFEYAGLYWGAFSVMVARTFAAVSFSPIEYQSFATALSSFGVPVEIFYSAMLI